MTAIAEAIDRLVESNAALRKSRALAKLERTLARSMSAAFQSEERAFLAKFARLKSKFPKPIQEVAELIPWEPVFDEAALSTLQAFTKPLDEFTARSLLSGMTAAVAELSLETSFDLKHPDAVEYLKQRSTERMTQIADTTRKQLRTILTQAGDEGWSYNRTAKAIHEKYATFSKVRAKNIAVFELGDAYEHGNMLVAKDLQAGGLEMQKSWLTVGDDRVRPEHSSNQGEGWIDLDATFSSGNERPPTDPRCLPGDCRVSAEGITATSERRYEGDLVVILTASHKQLSCTPNHPILTPHGWVAAGFLQEGGDVISSSGREWVRAVGDLDDDHMPATIEEIACAFRRTSKVTARPVIASPAFHGDGKGSKVAVIRSNSFLRDSRYTTISKHLLEDRFMARVGQRFTLPRLSTCAQRLKPWRSSDRDGVRSLNLVRSLLRRHLFPLQSLSFALVPDGNPSLNQSPPDQRPRQFKLLSDLIFRDARLIKSNDFTVSNFATIAAHGNSSLLESLEDERLRDIELARDLLDGSSGEVFVDKIIRVDRTRFKGHVYNLQTVLGAYIANGIVTHNCRCTLLMRRKPDA